MKRKITLLRLTIIIAVLASVGIAMAVIPPPPADQTIGIYDTVYGGFDEAGCRACHSSGVPNTHHMLVENEGYGCLDCHVLDPDEGIIAPRDCIVCHDASPHHTLDVDAAVARHCSVCHGSFVDDYDDEHYIPTYEPSLVTPNTTYRVLNTTTGKKWGGCEACHEPDASMSPAIDSNPATHHAALAPITCSGPLGNICHGVTGPEPPIRACEDCHGVKSIHNIQYDYVNTSGELGYGHIGDNWDCMGCHAWYDPDRGLLPVDLVIVPFMSSITPSSLVTGEETVVTIVGLDFVTTVEGTTHTSNVDVGGEIVEPDNITATEITVTIPALDTGNYGVHLVKAELRSNMLPVVVAPVVKIDSVTVAKDGTTRTIKGAGFGDRDPSDLDSSLGLTVVANKMKGTKIQRDPTVLSWSDTEVLFTYSAKLDEDSTVTITTVFGNDTANPGDT
ncbi:IPT/TIG domain-containing protein [Methanophagales archaeon]|nr:IPT/TIG domain-containing protein [Methanophagales archaeon]